MISKTRPRPRLHESLCRSKQDQDQDCTTLIIGAWSCLCGIMVLFLLTYRHHWFLSCSFIFACISPRLQDQNQEQDCKTKTMTTKLQDQDQIKVVNTRKYWAKTINAVSYV